MRQLIADKLTLSKQSVPHFYLFADVVMDNALLTKSELKKNNNLHVTITDIIVYHVARAMGEFSLFNSHVFHDRYLFLKDINIGLAVASEDGLRVPVILHADKEEIGGLSVKIRQLTTDAKKGKMVPGLKAGLTISTLGMYGIPRFLPVINTPESAILAIGQSSPKVTTDGKNIAIKNMLTLTLACDHRLIDGVYAAEFLNKVKALIENEGSR